MPVPRLFRPTAAIAAILDAWLLWARPAPVRALALGVALVGFFWALSGREETSGGFERLALSLGVCAAFWWAVLTLLLEHRTLFASGALLLLAAAAAHAAVIVGQLSRRRDTPRAVQPILYGLVFVAVALATLGVVESLARTLSPLRTYEIVPDDPAAGPCLVRLPEDRLIGRPGCSGRYVHREFAGVEVEINALGLRDGLDETAPPAAGELSVVVLGDSFAFGLGVPLEETFQERLEPLLEAELDRPVRVYGAGMPGGGVIDERHMLEQLAPIARPDLVVLALFEGNDLQDTWSRRQRPDEAAPLAESESESGEPALRFLAGLAGSRFWLGSSSLLQWNRVDGRPTRVMEMALRAERPASIDEMTAALIDELGAVEAVCRRLGADLLVLLVPTLLEAEPARFEAFAERHPAEHFERTGFHLHLTEQLGESGFAVIDTLPRLESESLAGRPCYHREGHWNGRGHEVAAELLASRAAQILARREPNDRPGSGAEASSP